MIWRLYSLLAIATALFLWIRNAGAPRMIWLYSLLTIALGLCLWFGKRARFARQWGTLFKSAAAAEQSGDLSNAERILREADSFAEGKMASLLRMAAKESLARVLFKRGQLESSAALTFDLLQLQQGST